MNEDKIKIKIVEKVDDANKKLASFEWQFLNSSLGPKDMELIKEMGIETYTELECIDERAAAQTILTGRIRIEKNYPGGGFDYLNPEDISQILSESNGLVVLDPHRGCGWGKIRLDYYTKDKKDIEYVKSLVKKAFSNNNFLNSVLRSSKLQKYYNFRADFDRAYDEAFAEEGKITYTNDVHAELIDLAFAFSKLAELMASFEVEAEKLGLDKNNIRLNPDLLFDQPGYHVAAGAVLNLTKRQLVKRFSLENAYQEAFFADLDIERMPKIFELILSILESEHSATKEVAHDIFVVCTEEQLNTVLGIFETYKKERNEVKTTKNIYIHVVDDDERCKSREQILSLIR